MTAPIDAALKRFETALNQLEDAIETRLEGALHVADLENEVQRLGTNRSQLAQSLDTVKARAVQLESANREVSQRLTVAMDSIRAVLDQRGT